MASVVAVRTVPKRVDVRLSSEDKATVNSVRLLVNEALDDKLARSGDRGGGGDGAIGEAERKL